MDERALELIGRQIAGRSRPSARAGRRGARARPRSAARRRQLGPRFSSYGLIVGSSSVSASFRRMKPFMWLSATWCTTWRTVQPPGRYGVSSCASVRPATAARIRRGSAAMSSMAAPRTADVARRDGHEAVRSGSCRSMRSSSCAHSLYTREACRLAAVQCRHSCRMRLVLAEGPLLDRILDFTLSDLERRADARGLRPVERGAAADAVGPRAVCTASRCLMTQGRLLASAKRYRFDARLDGRDGVDVRASAPCSRRPSLRGPRPCQSARRDARRARARGRARPWRRCSPRSATSSTSGSGFSLVPLDEVTVDVVAEGRRAGDAGARRRRARPAGHCGHARDARGGRVRFALRRDPALILLRACEEAAVRPGSARRDCGSRSSSSPRKARRPWPTPSSP